MEIITTEVYKNVDELMSNLPSAGRIIEIENEDEIINSILNKIGVLMCNAPKPQGNIFQLSLSKSERIVLFNWLKNNKKLDQLLTYNLWYTNNNYIYL